MMDVILRNLKAMKDENEFVVDIGINFEEINTKSANEFYLKGVIEDIGDLSVFAGYHEFDLSGYTVEPGKTKPEPFITYSELEKINPIDLYNDGYVNVLLNDENSTAEYSALPFNIIASKNSFEESKIKTEEPANFIIKKDNAVKYVVVNGFLIDVEKVDNWTGNSIIYNK
jgi:hypothetical protein